MTQTHSYDLQDLGLKVGIEIHQQLRTARKLFCRCPAGRYTADSDGTVLRHMRPTLSELGEYDGTALMEFKTKKNVTYLLHRDSVCTYEMDDTPPFLVNQEALDIAMEIALLLGCTIIDEMHVARKQYLDGSIPTGFQRTAIVGVDGSLTYKDRTINIRQVNLEEDACREVSDNGHAIVFRTDRLGTPLVEIITDAQIHTPEDAAGVIEELGRIMRVTGKVRRGIGSVRQDVNVSITGGTRVEIKGVPQIPWVPALVRMEAFRQKALLDVRDELRQRGISSGTLRHEVHKLTDLYRESGYRPLRQAAGNGEIIRGIKISGIRGLLAFPVQPGRPFADELAGRIRVIACLDMPPILIHTDDYPRYEGYERDLAGLRELFRLGVMDAVLICHGSDADTNTAVDEIRLRILEAIDGVPNETRQAFPDGTTDFERILPGPNRMYPDTDHPPVRIDRDRVETISRRLARRPQEREKSYRQAGVPEHLLGELSISPHAHLFERITGDSRLDPKTVAVVLMEKMKALRRAGIPVEAIPADRLQEFFELWSAGSFYAEASSSILSAMAWNPEISVRQILAYLNLVPLTEEEIRQIIKKIIDGHRQGGDHLPSSPEALHRMIMGQAMVQVRGRHPGRSVATYATAYLEERS